MVHWQMWENTVSCKKKWVFVQSTVNKQKNTHDLVVWQFNVVRCSHLAILAALGLRVLSKFSWTLRRTMVHWLYGLFSGCWSGKVHFETAMLPCRPNRFQQYIINIGKKSVRSTESVRCVCAFSPIKMWQLFFDMGLPTRKKVNLPILPCPKMFCQVTHVRSIRMSPICVSENCGSPKPLVLPSGKLT